MANNIQRVTLAWQFVRVQWRLPQLLLRLVYSFPQLRLAQLLLRLAQLLLRLTQLLLRLAQCFSSYFCTTILARRTIVFTSMTCSERVCSDHGFFVVAVHRVDCLFALPSFASAWLRDMDSCILALSSVSPSCDKHRACLSGTCRECCSFMLVSILVSVFCI